MMANWSLQQTPLAPAEFQRWAESASRIVGQGVAAKSACRASEHSRQPAGGATPQRVSGSVCARLSC